MDKEIEMGKDIGTTFKMTEKMEAAISKLSFDADRSKSEIIRACVCLALPVIKANKSLIYRLDFSEFEIKQ